MSALLSANEIRLTYGYQTLLDGVTLAVAAGEKVGMVGRNGCGKTSLLKILTGQNQADSGDIALRRALRVGYLPQEFEIDPGLSVGENIAVGADITFITSTTQDKRLAKSASIGELRKVQVDALHIVKSYSVRVCVVGYCQAIRRMAVLGG